MATQCPKEKIRYLKILEEKDKINIMGIIAHELEKEIARLTEVIREKYPEVYRNIQEVPITIPNKVSDEVNIKELNKYLETLKSFLKTHSEK